MSKILSESLQEYRNLHEEEINESMSSYGKRFREIFLKVGYALIKAGRTKDFQKIVNTAKILKGKGWPKFPEIKKVLGDEKFKKFELILNFMNKQLPSFSVTPGGTEKASSGQIGKDDNERVAVISKAIGMTPEEVVALIKK